MTYQIYKHKPLLYLYFQPTDYFRCENQNTSCDKLNHKIHEDIVVIGNWYYPSFPKLKKKKQNLTNKLLGLCMWASRNTNIQLVSVTNFHTLVHSFLCRCSRIKSSDADSIWT